MENSTKNTENNENNGIINAVVEIRDTFERTVRYDQEAELKESINKLQKKFAKFDLQITYTTEVCEIEIGCERREGNVVINPIYGEGIKYIVKINLPKIKHDGFSFIGMINYVDEAGESLIYSMIENGEEVMKQYIGIKDDAFKCDHCGYKRQRNTVYIFRKEETNEYKMIGSDCGKEYFGLDVYRQLQKLMGWIEHTYRDIDAGGFYYFDIEKWCKYACYVLVRDKRYKKRWDFNENSTTDIVSYMFNPSKWESENKIRKEFIESLEVEGDKVWNWEEMMNYWKTGVDRTEIFNNNCWINLNMGNPKVGLLTWAVWGWMKACKGYDYRKKIEALKNSEWVGTVGEKMTLVLFYDGCITGEGSYGTWTLHKLHDENNNSFIKFGEMGVGYRISGSEEAVLQEGDAVKFVADIKAHNEREGLKQTQLGRLGKVKK